MIAAADADDDDDDADAADADDDNDDDDDDDDNDNDDNDWCNSESGPVAVYSLHVCAFSNAGFGCDDDADDVDVITCGDGQPIINDDDDNL